MGLIGNIDFKEYKIKYGENTNIEPLENTFIRVDNTKNNNDETENIDLDVFSDNTNGYNNSFSEKQVYSVEKIESPIKPQGGGLLDPEPYLKPEKFIKSELDYTPFQIKESNVEITNSDLISNQ